VRHDPATACVDACTRTAHMRACLSTGTNTYLHTHIHTHKLKHTLLFFLCQCDTLFRIQFDVENLLWASYCFFCLLLCCYETRKSILRLPPWEGSVLLCFIDPRVRKIRKEASSCPGIFSRTLRFYYVASSPGKVKRNQSFLSFFLSWVSKTQLNLWTKRMVNTRLAT